VPPPRNWLRHVNQPQTEAESLRECLRRGRPYGADDWLEKTAHRLGLESSLRPRARPRKAVKPAGQPAEGERRGTIK
jgi:putative transposase